MPWAAVPLTAWPGVLAVMLTVWVRWRQCCGRWFIEVCVFPGVGVGAAGGCGSGCGRFLGCFGRYGLAVLLVLIIVFWRRVVSLVGCPLVLLQVLGVGVF